LHALNRAATEQRDRQLEEQTKAAPGSYGRAPPRLRLTSRLAVAAHKKARL